MYFSLQQRLLSKGKNSLFPKPPTASAQFCSGLTTELHSVPLNNTKVLGKSLKHSETVDFLTFSKLQVDSGAAAGKVMMGTLNNLSPNLTGV